MSVDDHAGHQKPSALPWLHHTTQYHGSTECQQQVHPTRPADHSSISSNLCSGCCDKLFRLRRHLLDRYRRQPILRYVLCITSPGWCKLACDANQLLHTSRVRSAMLGCALTHACRCGTLCQQVHRRSRLLGHEDACRDLLPAHVQGSVRPC
jgi:hypothetical protein